MQDEYQPNKAKIYIPDEKLPTYVTVQSAKSVDFEETPEMIEEKRTRNIEIL